MKGKLHTVSIHSCKNASCQFYVTCDVFALLHELHGADGLVLLDLVSVVPRLAVGLVLGAANIRPDSLAAAGSLHGCVADAHSLVEGLETDNDPLEVCCYSCHSYGRAKFYKIIGLSLVEFFSEL